MPRMPPEVDRVLKKAADFAFKAVRGNASIDHLPRPRQVFVIIYAAQGVIDNGGFRYFFESDWPKRPPYRVFSDAYREIGANEVADWLDQAAALFPFDDPHLYKELRGRFLDERCADDDSPMERLGNHAIDASKRVFTLLADYVRKHPGDFPLA